MTLLCERCCGPIHRSTEPLRLTWHRVPDERGGPARWLQSAVHALPCEEPDVGEWDTIRRGAAPAALRWAAERDDHR
ncbi:hypothetical protein [Pseudonocardia endophytica]|uniref:Uncharacterized protein n=1 Tax=Pseudonocardia endophytica TaxID=401976 RepID=A0A4R1HLP2_PSEEN|nr:hypothetical protein [Pseudonocardia endophytica]TCK22908.1 hypothetical protein EV378_6919 [Pseudonocardia endophytica]